MTEPSKPVVSVQGENSLIGNKVIRESVRYFTLSIVDFPGLITQTCDLILSITTCYCIEGRDLKFTTSGRKRWQKELLRSLTIPHFLGVLRRVLPKSFVYLPR